MTKLNDKLTVLIDSSLRSELEKYHTSKGISCSDAVRELLTEALFAQNEATYANVCRMAVREELNKFLYKSQMQKEYAADDFYDRVSASVSSEIEDIRRVAGANLYLLATTTSVACADSYARQPSTDEPEGYIFTRDDWYQSAMKVAPYVGADSSLDISLAIAEGGEEYCEY